MKYTIMNRNLSILLNTPRELAMKRLYTWFMTHKYCLILLYFIPYSLAYFLIGHYRIPVFDIRCSLDDYIPFNKYFVIPYCLWYFYVGATLFFLMIRSKKEFLQFTSLLFGGTTICILIFLIFPSSVSFRPEINGTDIFTKVIAFLFTMDRPTNVCPSIHVYASLATHIAIQKSGVLFQCRSLLIRHMIHGLSFIFAILVCLSTVFLKQHSVIDGIAALVLCGILYMIVYRIPVKSKARRFNLT